MTRWFPAFALVSLSCSSPAPPSTGAAGSGGGQNAGGGDPGGGGQSAAGGMGFAGSPSQLSCPPLGPYGQAVGDVAANATLFECDGTAVELHELCENDVSLVYTFAAWCPVCRSHMEAGLPNQLLADYESLGFVEWVVVTEDASGGAADGDLCEVTRDTYSLTPRVLYDPNNELNTNVGVQVNTGGLVLSRGSVIELNVGYDIAAVQSTVATLYQ
jgi:hypothetical protein